MPANTTSAAAIGTLEFGAKIRNAHKFDNTYNESWCTDDSCGGSGPIPVAQHPEWYGTFSDPDYYDGHVRRRIPCHHGLGQVARLGAKQQDSVVLRRRPRSEFK